MFVFVQKGKDILAVTVGFGGHGSRMKTNLESSLLSATFRPGGLAETAAIKSGATILTLSVDTLWSKLKEKTQIKVRTGMGESEGVDVGTSCWRSFIAKTSKM